MTTLLKEMVTGCVQYGDFRLSSGRRSRWYCDLRVITFTSTGLREVGTAMVKLLDGLTYTIVGGPLVGAAPLVGAMLAAEAGLRGFLIRDQRKAHGAAGRRGVCGPLQRGDRAVILDDVATSGASIVRAIEAVVAAGALVVAAAVILDREEGAAGLLGAMDVPLLSLFKVGDIVIPEEQS